MPGDIIAQKGGNGRNYIPIDIDTRYHACLRRAESGWGIRKVLSYYHIKRSSLYRWLKRFDGTKDSLMDGSHRPKSDHPRMVKGEKAKKVLDLHRRAPDASFLEIWAKMGAKDAGISASTVLRIMKRNGGYEPYAPNKKKHDKRYETPEMVGEKWQLDVKYVPTSCKAPGLEGRYYQYTVIDECSRKRALYFSDEQSTYETVKAVGYAISLFGYKPREIQTDNGVEFGGCARKKNPDGKDLFGEFCRQSGIRHHFIRPRTPEHNGKVERSHRTDQDKFYRSMRFFSLGDLRKQGKAWEKRYNSIPKQVLGYRSPDQVELEKLRELMETTGEIRCLKRLTSIGS